MNDTSNEISNDTSFLYPFLSDGERDPAELLAELAESARAKLDESDRLMGRSLAENEVVLDAAAGEIAERLSAGGSLLAFGNGGSACDSMAFVRQMELADPAQPVAARTLAADPAILSAVSNDVGTEQVFSRQVEAFGGPDDIAVAFSTSGQSPNLLRALGMARQRGLLTVAFAGYSGGAMLDNTDVDHCLIVHSQSVHRIQEAQAHLSLRLRTLIASHETNTGSDVEIR